MKPSKEWKIHTRTAEIEAFARRSSSAVDCEEEKPSFTVCDISCLKAVYILLLYGEQIVPRNVEREGSFVS